MSLFNKNNSEHLKLSPYQREYLSEFSNLELKTAPYPWINYKFIYEEGQIATGWVSSNLILLVSFNRYSIFDIITNEIVESISVASTSDLFSADNLSFKLEKKNQVVNVFGIFGGNGNRYTSDAWKLDVIYPAWPNACVMIRQPKVPGENIHPWEGVQLIKLNILDYSELMVGFSPDEKSFIIWGGSGCEVYSRS